MRTPFTAAMVTTLSPAKLARVVGSTNVFAID
jgi:hypothetical protein